MKSIQALNLFRRPLSPRSFFVLLALFSLNAATLLAQPEEVGCGNPLQNLGFDGSAQVFRISSTFIGQLNLRVEGGNGGSAQLPLSTLCIDSGGRGAIVSGTFDVTASGGPSGGAPLSLQPGGRLIVIVGGAGQNAAGNNFIGAGNASGGGGGGSAIRYLPPGSQSFLTLLVAGGGGGAYVSAAFDICTGIAGGDAGTSLATDPNGGSVPPSPLVVG